MNAELYYKFYYMEKRIKQLENTVNQLKKKKEATSASAEQTEKDASYYIKR